MIYLIDTVSIFKHTYAVESDNEETARKVIFAEESEEISQEHLTEMVTSLREVTQEEVLRVITEQYPTWLDVNKLRLICKS